MGYDEVERFHNIILNADIDVLHLRPINPENFCGATFPDIEKFKELTENFVTWVYEYSTNINMKFSKSIAKKGSEMDYVDGNHHFFVNNPIDTAEKITKFIS